MASCHGCTVSRASGQQWVKRATFFGTEPMLKVVKIVNFRGHSFKIMDEGNNSFFLVMIELYWVLLLIIVDHWWEINECHRSTYRLVLNPDKLFMTSLVFPEFVWKKNWNNLFAKKIKAALSVGGAGGSPLLSRRFATEGSTEANSPLLSVGG